jgi:hypothetical protein
MGGKFCMSRKGEKYRREQKLLPIVLKVNSSYCTRAIRKVTSDELLTKQTMRKNVIIYKEYLHT